MIGARGKRREDRRLLPGRGRYVDDVVRPGLPHAAIVRSPHAHAAIRDVLIWPLAPDATRMIVYNLFPREFADEPDFAERAQVHHHYLHLSLAEDREMVASLQSGVGSTRFVPGRMSFLEKGIHHVLNAYLERIFDGKEGAR